MPYNIEGHIDSLFGKELKASSPSGQSVVLTGFLEVGLQAEEGLQAGGLCPQQVAGDKRYRWDLDGKEAGP